MLYNNILRTWPGVVSQRSLVFAQSNYSEGQLKTKQRFSERERGALSEPFLGVTDNGQPTPDLFPVRSTGVSTQLVVEAASKFLKLLTVAQLLRTQTLIKSQHRP